MSELRAIARGVPGAEWRRIIAVPSPAAGVDVTIPVQAKRAWQVLDVMVTLVASGTAGNRAPLLTIKDGDGTPWFEMGKTTAITATTTATIGWHAGINGETVAPATNTTLPLPAPCYAMPGETLTITGHTAVNDQWSNVRLVVLETYIGDAAYEANTEQRIRDHWRAIYDLTH